MGGWLAWLANRWGSKISTKKGGWQWVANRGSSLDKHLRIVSHDSLNDRHPEDVSSIVWRPPPEPAFDLDDPTGYGNERSGVL